MWDALKRNLGRLGDGSVRLLAGSGLLAAATWAFLELLDEVVEGDSESLDQALLLGLRVRDDLSDPIGPAWFEELVRDLTSLGSLGVLSLLTLAVAGYLLLHRQLRACLFLFGAVGGGLVLSVVLKEMVGRPRPDLVPHGHEVYTASFPSMHGVMSAATFLTLGAIAARMHSERRLRVYFVSCAVAATVLVGVSRVYLGVHWPTDVLAGWSLGAGWALACQLLARALQQEQLLESPR